MREEFLAERIAHWQDVLEKHPEFAKRIHAKMDLDQDGEISKGEWRKARPRVITALRKRHQERLQEFRENHPDAAEHIRKNADRNQDSKVGPLERAKARHEVRRGVSKIREHRSEKRQQRREK